MSSRYVYVFSTLCCVLCIALGAALLPGIQQIRREKKLVNELDIRGEPGDYALLATLLGGFRGIFVDLLWMRAARLEHEGRYFELIQLYDWIGRLQPRIDEVWRMNAWNMAYNITFASRRPDERWRWIKRAVDLLRDQGMRHSPHPYVIAWEIAQLFFDKIGSPDDEFNIHYKIQLALEMQRTLGWLRPDMKAVADSPRDLGTLFKKYPETQRLLEEASRMGISLEQCHGELLWKNAGLSPEQLNFIRNQNHRDALNKLSAFYAARSLRYDWKMDPTLMRDLVDAYGPIDWRSPFALSLYWGTISQQRAGPDASIYDRNAANRMVYFSLAYLFRTGRIFMEEDPETKTYYYLAMPEVDFADQLHAYFMDLIATAPPKEAEHAKYAHESFLEELTYTLFIFNQKIKAKHYYKVLGKLYPKKRYQVPFDEFLMNSLSVDLRDASFEQVMTILTGLLRQHLQAFAVGEDERAMGLVKLAYRIFSRYEAVRGN